MDSMAELLGCWGGLGGCVGMLLGPIHRFKHLDANSMMFMKLICLLSVVVSVFLLISLLLFYASLTVHLSVTFTNDQLDAHIF
jgi:hypothetical protein